MRSARRRAADTQLPNCTPRKAKRRVNSSGSSVPAPPAGVRGSSRRLRAAGTVRQRSNQASELVAVVAYAFAGLGDGLLLVTGGALVDAYPAAGVLPADAVALQRFAVFEEPADLVGARPGVVLLPLGGFLVEARQHLGQPGRRLGERVRGEDASVQAAPAGDGPGDLPLAVPLEAAERSEVAGVAGVAVERRRVGDVRPGPVAGQDLDAGESPLDGPRPVHHGEGDLQQSAPVLARAAQPVLVAPAVGPAQVVAHRPQEGQLVRVPLVGGVRFGEFLPGGRRPGLGELLGQVAADGGADDVAGEQVLAGAGDVLAEVLDPPVRPGGGCVHPRELRRHSAPFLLRALLRSASQSSDSSGEQTRHSPPENAAHSRLVLRGQARHATSASMRRWTSGSFAAGGWGASEDLGSSGAVSNRSNSECYVVIQPVSSARRARRWRRSRRGRRPARGRARRGRSWRGCRSGRS